MMAYGYSRDDVLKMSSKTVSELLGTHGAMHDHAQREAETDAWFDQVSQQGQGMPGVNWRDPSDLVSDDMHGWGL